MSGTMDTQVNKNLFHGARVTDLRQTLEVMRLARIKNCQTGVVETVQGFCLWGEDFREKRTGGLRHSCLETASGGHLSIPEAEQVNSL